MERTNVKRLHSMHTSNAETHMGPCASSDMIWMDIELDWCRDIKLNVLDLKGTGSFSHSMSLSPVRSP
jgi:hypothetical protein